MALETAANASVSQDPTLQAAGASQKNILKEITSPPGGQGEMDAARFGQTSILYDKKPWQPISKFHPILQQRQSLVNAKKESIAPRNLGPGSTGTQDGRPTFTPK